MSSYTVELDLLDRTDVMILGAGSAGCSASGAAARAGA